MIWVCAVGGEHDFWEAKEDEDDYEPSERSKKSDEFDSDFLEEEEEEEDEEAAQKVAEKEVDASNLPYLHRNPAV